MHEFAIFPGEIQMSQIFSCKPQGMIHPYLFLSSPRLPDLHVQMIVEGGTFYIWFAKDIPYSKDAMWRHFKLFKSAIQKFVQSRCHVRSLSYQAAAIKPVKYRSAKSSVYSVLHLMRSASFYLTSKWQLEHVRIRVYRRRVLCRGAKDFLDMGDHGHVTACPVWKWNIPIF